MSTTSDLFQEQLSEFVDDELSGDACEFLVRRVQRDPEAHAQLIRYHMIGAALRGDLQHERADVLRARIRAALQGPAAARTTPARERSRLLALAKPLVGAAAVAAVAVVLAVQWLNRDSAAEPVTAAASMQSEQQARFGVANYVPAPPSTGAEQDDTPPIRLTNYLMHHSEYASNLSRTAVRSNVVATWRLAGVDEDEGTSR